eukprot:Rhum_TRINITY_DN14189_c1_g1::Rhum_TRINITY_DN14189_c1_g1_i1::g.71299::m.71299
MLVTASWGGGEAAVELDADCRSVAALRERLQTTLPVLDVGAMCLMVGGRSICDDDDVLGLVEGSVVDVSPTPAALAAETLREEGYDVGFSGLRAAAESGFLRLCRLYVEAGVVWPPRVENPLHVAVRNGNRELCDLFLGSPCCEKDALSHRGETALHVAIKMKSVQLCKLLLDSGCATEVKSLYGSTPLHLAASSSVKLCTLLLDAGCAKNVKDAMGATPLDLAKKYSTWPPPLRRSACDSTSAELVEYLRGRGCV